MWLDDVRYPAPPDFDDMLSRKAAEPVVGVIRHCTVIPAFFRSGRLNSALRGGL